MKKFLCCLMAMLIMMTLPALTEATPQPAPETVRLAFEDGFSLTLPSGWVRHAVDPALADLGYIYCLGSADGANLMYIQRWKTDVGSMDELIAAMEERNEIQLRTVNASESGEPFVMYSFSMSDASGGMMLLDGSILNLLFTPKSDEAMMLTAAAILTSYAVD